MKTLIRRALVVSVLIVGILVVAETAAGAAEPPRVVPGAGSVVEGDAGSVVVEVPVRLSAPSADTVTVQWATIFGPGVAPPNPAVPGVDFEAATGTVTFVPGDTEEVASITVFGDTVIEPDEYIVAAFHSPTNAVMGGFWGLGFGIITNDDVPPPRSITVTPDTALSGGQIVTVQGTGYAPGASIGVCQANAAPPADPPQDGCLQGSGAIVMTTADSGGSFSVAYQLVRRAYVPSAGGFVDCADPATPCVIGAADIANVAGTVSVAALAFAEPPPPPTTLGQIVVTPSSGLVDGQTLAASGTGFRANAVMELYPCLNNTAVQDNCDWSKKVVIVADPVGAFDTTVVASQFVFDIDCATSECSFAAAEAVDPVGTLASTPVSFGVLQL